MSDRRHGERAHDAQASDIAVCGDHALLQGYAENVLAADEARAVKAHVATCAACRATLSEYKQLMWDLSHPMAIELPEELERTYDTLMDAWKTEHQSAAATRPRALVPSWATHTIAWARYLPTTSVLRALASRARNLPGEGMLSLWKRRKGGERH